MNPGTLRILLLADTHLGFDSPIRPRVERRRRGPDFFANYELALQPARSGEVDLVVHGGDLLYRTRVPPVLVEQALTPLAEIAQSGMPVFLIPGNHESSRIPLHLLAATPNLHIFHRPQTVLLELNGVAISLSGFPFARRIGEKFDRLLDDCDYASVDADCRLLCLHQSVEGATVGLHDYTFRSGPEVIAGKTIPSAFDAVLAGHIHRSQLLTHDLSGRPLPAPVIYPGSIERTSFAERLEDKQFALLTITRHSFQSRCHVAVSFKDLPTRPMKVLSVNTADMSPPQLASVLRRKISALDPDAVVQVRLNGPMTDELASVANVATLRALAPETMNISLAGRRHEAAGLLLDKGI